MSLMPIEHINDWEQRLTRQNAFWEREIIGRPPVYIAIRKPGPVNPGPTRKLGQSRRDLWLDTEYVVDTFLAWVDNTEFLGDALPIAWPNFGPDIFAAFFGAELEFGETTSWSTPIFGSLDEMDRIEFNKNSFWWKKLLEMTDALLVAGKGKFYTGVTDLHVGGDALAAFRGPEGLSIDLIERPEDVAGLLERITQAYFRIIDFFYDKFTAQGLAFASWFPIVASCKWYVPSNDFSCMISSQMFNETFLPGIRRECQHLGRSIYHLDGPNALRHLDSILAIPELSALQFAWGAGHGRASDWLNVYQRAQAAGKGIWLNCHVDELDVCMENLKPQGVLVHLSGIKSREQADVALQKISAWR